MNTSHAITINSVDGEGCLCTVGTLAEHSKTVNALSYNEERHLLASCDDDCLLVWDLNSQSILLRFEIVILSSSLHSSPTSSVFSGSDLFFAQDPALAKSIAGILRSCFVEMLTVHVETLMANVETSMIIIAMSIILIAAIPTPTTRTHSTTLSPSPSNSPTSATRQSPFSSYFT